MKNENIKTLQKILMISKDFEMKSLSQLIFFLEVAKKNKSGITIFDLSGSDDAKSKEYKNSLGQFRKLSKGAVYRNNDGLGLLEYIENGQNRRIGLTDKGEQLLLEIEKGA